MSNYNYYSGIRGKSYKFVFAILILLCCAPVSGGFAYNTAAEHTPEGASDLMATVIRGPYLQSATTSSVVIRWRTDISTDSKVWYGNSPSNLTFTVSSGSDVTDHEIQLNGLSPNTIYYYAVGNSSGQLTFPNSFHHFETAATTGSSQLITAWALGDCGTANNDQRAVRNGYYNFAGTTGTDMILLLGNNAFDSGTDSEFQNAIFEDMYEDVLINSVIWPVPGDRDLVSASSSSESGPYYDIFTCPTGGEAGG